MAIRTVTGTILQQDSTPYANVPVIFNLIDVINIENSNAVAAQVAYTNNAGIFTINLWVNDYLTTISYECQIYQATFKFSLGTGISAINLGSIKIPPPLNGDGSQSVSGTVSVSNFPSNQTVNLSGTLPGYATIPSFKIDQTTPGTTNKVDIGTDGSVSVSGIVAANQGGTWNLNNITGSISLPTGASTSSLQTTGNTSLSSIDSKTATLGQALAASSVPVVLTASQLSILTPFSNVGITGTVAVTGYFYQATQPVSIATLPALPTGTNSIGNIGNTAFGISGTLPAFTATPTFKIDQSIAGTSNQVSAVQNGTWNITNISGTVSLPTGASTSALQTTINTTLETLATASAQTTGNTTLSTISTNISNILSRLMPGGTDTNYVGTSVADCVKTSSGNLYSITAVNLNTATRYLQIFNQATIPTTGNVPIRVYTIFGNAGNTLIGQDILGGSGISLSTGVAWGVSTTPLTYTTATTTDTIVSVRWA